MAEAVDAAPAVDKTADVEEQVLQVLEPTQARQRISKRPTEQPRQRMNHSNWMITANTNRRFERSEAEEAIEWMKRLQAVCQEVFATKKLFEFFCPPDNDNFRMVKVKTEFAVEFGEVNHNVHAHIILMTAHYGNKIKLAYNPKSATECGGPNQKDLTTYFQAQFYGEDSMKSVQVHADRFADTELTLQEYITKNHAKMVKKGTLDQ
jgi:hypothetical protein